MDRVVLARPAGLEPATLGLEGRCSIRAELRARLKVTASLPEPCASWADRRCKQADALSRRRLQRVCNGRRLRRTPGRRLHPTSAYSRPCPPTSRSGKCWRSGRPRSAFPNWRSPFRFDLPRRRPADPIDALRTATLLGVEGTAAFGSASLAFLRFTHGAGRAALLLALSAVVWMVVPPWLAARRLERTDI